MERKSIFLSFKPEYFRPILYNIKKYEYRKRFCKTKTDAYLYLSSPIREVIGIMKLSIPLEMDNLIEKYDEESIQYKRIKDALDKKVKYAIPIESLILFKKPIPIDKLKMVNPNFKVPQCYLNLDNYKDIFDYLKSQDMYLPEYINSHDYIYDDNIGKSCHDMELTDEFKLKDKKYKNNKKYNMIKPYYINKDLFTSNLDK